MIAVKFTSLTSWYCWLCWHCCHLQFGAPEAVHCHHSVRAGISRRIRNHNRIGIINFCSSSSYAHGEKEYSRYYNIGRWSLGTFSGKFNRPTLHLLRKLKGGHTFDHTISRGSRTVHVDDNDGAESWKEKGWDDSAILPVIVSSAKMCTYVDTRAEFRSLRRSDTVMDLKRELQKIFPGHPPASLQRLFRGTQLLSDEIILGEITIEEEGSSRGQLQLLLDAPPPVDADTFDSSTIVPSTREALLESYFSNLMALQQMQNALSKASAGDPSPFVHSGNSEDMACSVDMVSGYQNLLEYFWIISKDMVVPEPPDPALDPMAVGPLHEIFRDWARVLDVEWSNTIRIVTFMRICCHFGVSGPLQRVVKNIIFPFALLYQTRWARVFRKVAWNLIPVVPGLSEAVEALLPAPEQALLNLDKNRYTRELYGTAGPEFSSEYIENYMGNRDVQISTNEGDDHDTVRNLKCKEGDEETNYSSDDWVDDEDDTENGEDEETVEDEDWKEEDYI